MLICSCHIGGCFFLSSCVRWRCGLYELLDAQRANGRKRRLFRLNGIKYYLAECGDFWRSEWIAVCHLFPMASNLYYCPYVEPMYLMQMATPIRLTARISIATPGDASVANPHENLVKEKLRQKKRTELRNIPEKASLWRCREAESAMSRPAGCKYKRWIVERSEKSKQAVATGTRSWAKQSWWFSDTPVATYKAMAKLGVQPLPIGAMRSTAARLALHLLTASRRQPQRPLHLSPLSVAEFY